MPAPLRRAVVIANPAARRALPPGTLEAAAVPLRARGWDVSIEVAASREDTLLRATRAAREGAEAVLACGGDGSLATVVRGVLDARDAGDAGTTAVGVVPAGTANVWAAETGVPVDPQRAFALIEDGVRRPVDIGWARIGEGRPTPFLLVCGAGLDAAVVRAVESRPAWKRRAGRLAFAIPALAALASWPTIAARVTLDGEAVEAPRLLLALATNATRYGGVARLAAGTAFDDGLLDVTLFEGDRAVGTRLILAMQALRGRLDERPLHGVTHRRVSRMTLTPARALPVEVDGDYLGTCTPDAPLHVEVAPRALTVIAGASPRMRRSG